ncbi:uncharacterized protein LOC122368902 [Amphibalanus amphitrite]|uniref:uncharacterized protein LOC122368902 n=1 Tax=Amphibalanus amphitrite TaxID=1232801 RepID=UPI001C906480|nr:uncharacterized protein LOC122368902 [Amphibalanus amphitrite]
MSASSETADEAPVMVSHTETNDVTCGSSDVTKTSSEVTCEVLVIGAGISGLTAAYEIQKRNPKTELCLVEAKDRVGGRTLATQIRVREGQTETFDLGGQWVGSTQTDIMEMLDELGLEVYPQYIQGTKHMQLGGDAIRRYSSTIPNLGSWWGLVQLQLFIWKVDRLAKKCSPLSPCSDRSIRDLDGVSVEAFARQNISNTAALEAIIAACRVILGCDASRVSVVHFLAYTHAAGGLNALLEATPGTAQEFKVKCATWVWTDGSATDGVLNGGAGALIVWPDGEERSVRAPAGRLCSSFRAEMVALQTALSFLLENPLHADDPVVICTDSQSALAALREGPAAQHSPLGGAIWRALRGLTAGDRQVHLQWVPSHCGLEGNERADSIAKEASNLAQDQAPIDVQTAYRAAAREADTPQHVLLRCPALMATRHRLLGSINPDLEEVRSGAIVAALGAAHRSLQSRTATSQL